MALQISNRDARRLWLDAQGLSATPTGSLDVMAIIRDLGFVQLDTIQAVARAHHHILWSRNQNYREPMLDRLLAEDRAIFEHFTHDASVLPIEHFPYWQRQFRRLGEKTARWEQSRAMLDADGRAAIRARIAEEGPLSTHAFDTKAPSSEMWARPPHKMALDHMWYAGELATSHRENFTKYYDISERVIPDHLRETEIEDAAQIDWLCRSALDRLGFGSEGDVMRFWAAAALGEVKTWRMARGRDLVEVEVACADRTTLKAWAPPDIEERLANLPAPTSRLRILNPFDPAVRDRKRLARLFGFDFRIEIFVPAAQRKWGYYVMPILERDRFVGRIEAKADRKAGVLTVSNVWPEPCVKWGQARWDKLDAELDRLGRFVGCRTVIWEEGARNG
ncbi:crosslink repair DNA glycosylase YcaQ family protein [Parasphingopyxis sp.]|uniref:winged helix-turn-helix domain-containing protein n=1 Tax=Parasphingopyxis sp. TaxID=1920299 RepID=UPI00260E4C3E|nr:crosslink repair DNA glycosylase YcaQ family protein [Parasphingopyxis sp.]